jgi:hypothetical protein
MTFDEGKHRLMVHAGLVVDPASMPGLLGTLRPYQGIQEALFHDLVEAIFAISSSLSSPEPHVDKDVVHSLLYINRLVRTGATEPTGPLRRNRLITDADVATLERWLDVVERVVLRYLRGLQHHVALFAYVEYLEQSKSSPTAQQQFIIPILLELVEHGDSDHQVSAVVALGKFGKLAISAIPTLRQLLKESPDLEVREACDVALLAIVPESLRNLGRFVGPNE